MLFPDWPIGEAFSNYVGHHKLQTTGVGIAQKKRTNIENEFGIVWSFPIDYIYVVAVTQHTN